MGGEMGGVPCIGVPVSHPGAAVLALSLAPGLAEGAGRQPLPQQMKPRAMKRSLELSLQPAKEREGEGERKRESYTLGREGGHLNHEIISASCLT